MGIFDNIAWFEGNPTWNFHQLSPEPMWNLPAQWNITAPGFRVRSITASPEQDLLVLVEEMCVSFKVSGLLAISSTLTDQPAVYRTHKTRLHTKRISFHSARVLLTPPRVPRSYDWTMKK